MKKINFGENVRRIRAIKGYNQQYMATKLGFKNQNKYSRIEASPKIPDPEIVAGIAQIFEMSVDELLVAQVHVDTPEKLKARIGIYTTITYLLAIAVGIICAEPAWIMANEFCIMQGITESVAILIRLVVGFTPLFLCLRAARKVTKRYKIANSVE